MLWESIITPTTMVITGFAEQYTNTYNIYEDDIQYTIIIEEEENSIEAESCGYLNLLSIDEFCKLSPQDDFENFYCNDSGSNMYILPNFIGDIYVKKLNLVTNEYFEYDGSYDDDIYKVVVCLPKNTKITSDFRKFPQILDTFQTNNFDNPFEI